MSRTREQLVVTHRLEIEIPALARPTLDELRKKYPKAEMHEIEDDFSPTEPITLCLATVLEPNEQVNGEEYERRFRAHRSFLLGYQQGAWLEEHQHEFPQIGQLMEGVHYIDFSGLVVVDARGKRRMPCLFRNPPVRYRLDWYWLHCGFNRTGRLAISGKK